MQNPLVANTEISALIKSKLYLPGGIIAIFFVIFSFLFITALAADDSLIFLIIACVVPSFYLMIKNPKLWIYTIALTNIYFLFGRGNDVTKFEIVLAFLYLGSLAGWLFWTLAVKRERIIENLADLSFFVFLIFVGINGIIAYINAVDMLMWARETANFALIAIYFPIRKYFTDKKDLMVLIYIYIFVISVISGLHIYTYYKAFRSDAVYAFQLLKGVNINQALFTSASIFGFIFSLYQKSKFKTILMMVFTILSIIGLLTSFSRTTWVILAVELFIVLFYLTGKQRIKMIFLTTIASVILVSTVFYFFADKAKILIQVIENRFVSTSKGVKDASVQIRFQEYQSVFKGIEEYPMAGNGIASEIQFWNYNDHITTHTRIIHNGYLYIMYRLGIPALILCFFPFLYYLLKAHWLARNLDDEFFRLISIGCLFSILCILIASFTATQHVTREGIFVTALTFAFIGITIKNLNDGKIRLKEKL